MENTFHNMSRRASGAGDESRLSVHENGGLLLKTEPLCFDVDRFIGDNFHVDKFVSECKDKVSLHTLREDLEAYYKNIRIALIDLINQDYADFVSLSSNLVGMEKSIENLRHPLGQLREEVGMIKKDLNRELTSIQDKLTRRRDVREKKTKLQHLLNVISSVQKIEKILLADPSCKEMEIFMEGSRESVGHFLERVAGEFNQLQFHVNQSKGHPLVNDIKSRVSLITSKLQESLETSFQEGLAAGQSDLVLRCLRTYALIDKTGHAEDLFRYNFVRPKLIEIITEERFSSEGLDAICESVLKFVRSGCEMLLKLTSEKASSSSKEDGQNIVKGFDFLVNSVWPEVDDSFETKLSFIFSPGNPDAFFERYQIMMAFLEKFEASCTSLESFKRLRGHSGYQAFMAKWSLPVYFQIRLQEIGGSIESAVGSPFEEAEELSGDFSTNLVRTTWKALNKCWDDKVFVQPLTSRFWKLFLQIISRMTVFLADLSIELQTFNNGSSTDSSGKNLEEAVKHNINDLGRLYGDLGKLTLQVNKLFEDKIKALLQKVCEDHIKQHEDAFKESLDGLSKYSDGLSEYFVKYLSEEGMQQLENAKNVPRLYRRTNREPPSQASAYITLAFSQLRSFDENLSKSIQSDNLKEILKNSVFTMTSRYYVIVDDLAASIKKTEESLQRLKRLRKGAESTQSSTSNEMTDENKIRKQLLLDVQQFGKEAECYAESAIIKHEEYRKLLELVTNANKTI